MRFATAVPLLVASWALLSREETTFPSGLIEPTSNQNHLLLILFQFRLNQRPCMRNSFITENLLPGFLLVNPV